MNDTKPSFWAGGVRPFLLGILAVALYLAYTVLRPFLHSLIIAAVLAALFHPVHTRLMRLMRGKPNLAALATVGVICVAIVLPLLLVTSAMVEQGLSFTDQYSEWTHKEKIQEALQDPRVAGAIEWVKARFPRQIVDLDELKSGLLKLANTASQKLIAAGAGLLGNMASLISNFFITLFVTFYFLRDGHDILRHAKSLSPLRDEQEDRILLKARAVSRSVFVGTLLTAVMQGLAGGVGLAIAGLPGAFWGVMMAFASLIPVVGTALIWIPATGWLLAVGSWKMAIFLAAWSIVVVGGIDNFLRPLFMKGEGGLSPFYIFLAIMGGMSLFGLAGILYGPLILGFAKIMLVIYEEEFRGELKCIHPDEKPEIEEIAATD